MTQITHEQTPDMALEPSEYAGSRLFNLAQNMRAGSIALALVGVLTADARLVIQDRTPERTAAESFSHLEALLAPAEVSAAPRPQQNHKQSVEVQPEEPIKSFMLKPTASPAPVTTKVHVQKPIKQKASSAPSETTRPHIVARPALESQLKPVRVADVSWPPNNCEAEIPPSISGGIVGLNGGRPFTQNPCLQEEAAKFDRFALYVNTNNPGVANPFNYGYRAGKYAVSYAAEEGVYRSSIWLDVEGIRYYSEDKEANVDVLKGEMAGIRAAAKKRALPVPRFGVYSATVPGSNKGMYEVITGGWKNHLPAWVAAGECDEGYDFTDGGVVMVQHVVKGLDTDTVCPGYSLQDVL